jgi:hypothetical protein
MKIDGEDIANNRYLVSFKICTLQWIYIRRFIFFPSFSSPKGTISRVSEKLVLKSKWIIC